MNQEVGEGTGEQNAESGLLFDADGFLLPGMRVDTEADTAHLLTRLLNLDPSMRELHEAYYLLVRAGATWCGPQTDETQTTVQTWRNASYRTSLALLEKHVSTGEPVSPLWLELYNRPLIGSLAAKHEHLRSVSVCVTLEPRFYARTSHGRIQVSALLREFLRNYNLTICNLVEPAFKQAADLVNSKGVPWHLIRPRGLHTSLRMMLPYLLYSSGCVVSSSRLPSMAASSRAQYNSVLLITKLQTMFILAHEYGHIALGHDNRPRTRQERLDIEREADRFAFTAMLDVVRTDELGTVGDLWIAVRWLHQYQLLDEMVGLIWDGQDFEFEDLGFDARKNDMYALLPKDDLSTVANMVESIGVQFLLEQKAALKQLGAEFLRQVADELSLEKPGPNAAWWSEVVYKDTPA